MSPFENVAPAMSIVTDKGICSYQKHKGGLVVGFSFVPVLGHLCQVVLRDAHGFSLAGDKLGRIS